MSYTQYNQDPEIYIERSGAANLRRMSQKSRRSFPFWDNADQNYIVPALKKCVQLLIKFLKFRHIKFKALILTIIISAGVELLKIRALNRENFQFFFRKKFVLASICNL